MLIFCAAGLQIRPSGACFHFAEHEQLRTSLARAKIQHFYRNAKQNENFFRSPLTAILPIYLAPSL